jgi:hypothetical protein
MADNLLDKASILLTPTAYDNGRMLSVKPNENLYGSELVTNGDFATDSDWILTSGTNISNNQLNVSESSYVFFARQLDVVTIGKQYKVTFDIDIQGGNGVIVYLSDTNAFAIVETSGTHTFYFTSDGTQIRFRSYNQGFTGSIDNVSVKEDLSGDFTFSRAGNASRVNSSSNIVTESANIPRIDYTDGCGSWLLEGQSTNLYLNSETLLTQSNATSASTYTVSFYGTGTITFSGTHTGTLVGTGVNDRVSVTFTTTSGTLTSTISGTCTKGQLENLPYATSYIPTNGATSTRLQDIANNSGNSSLINSTEGVFYAEIAALANDGTKREISINNGTTTDRVQILLNPASNELAIFYKAQNGATQFTLSETLTDITQFNKIAFKWKANDFALWINGTETDTISSGVTSNANALTKIDFDQFNGGAKFYGKTKALAVYKEALTDAELQSLTTQ